MPVISAKLDWAAGSVWFNLKSPHNFILVAEHMTLQIYQAVWLVMVYMSSLNFP